MAKISCECDDEHACVTRESFGENEEQNCTGTKLSYKSSLGTLLYVEYPMDNFALTIEKHVNQQGNTDCIFNVSVWFTYYPSAVNPLMNMSLIIFIV